MNLLVNLLSRANREDNVFLKMTKNLWIGRDLCIKTCVGWLIRHYWRCISSAWKTDMILFWHYVPHMLQERDSRAQQVWQGGLPAVVKRHQIRCQTFQQLKVFIKREWQNIPLSKLQHIVSKGLLFEICCYTVDELLSSNTEPSNGTLAKINNSWVVLMLQSGNRIVLCCDKDGKIERSAQV